MSDEPIRISRCILHDLSAWDPGNRQCAVCLREIADDAIHFKEIYRGRVTAAEAELAALRERMAMVRALATDQLQMHRQNIDGIGMTSLTPRSEKLKIEADTYDRAATLLKEQARQCRHMAKQAKETECPSSPSDP